MEPFTESTTSGCHIGNAQVMLYHEWTTLKFKESPIDCWIILPEPCPFQLNLVYIHKPGHFFFSRQGILCQSQKIQSLVSANFISFAKHSVLESSETSSVSCSLSSSISLSNHYKRIGVLVVWCWMVYGDRKPNTITECQHLTSRHQKNILG